MRAQLHVDGVIPAELRRDLLGSDPWRQERARAALRLRGETAALDTLTDLLHQRRASLVERLPHALNALAPLCMLAALPTRNFAFVVAGFGLMFAGVAIDIAFLRRKMQREALLEALAEEASRADAGAEHLLDALTLARFDRRRRVETLRTALHAPLPRLLARLTDDDARALTPGQRDLLRRAVHARTDARTRSPWDHYSLEFSTAALLVLASAGDRAALSDARRIAASHDNERLRLAAEEYLRAVGG